MTSHIEEDRARRRKAQRLATAAFAHDFTAESWARLTPEYRCQLFVEWFPDAKHGPSSITLDLTDRLMTETQDRETRRRAILGPRQPPPDDPFADLPGA